MPPDLVVDPVGLMLTLAQGEAWVEQARAKGLPVQLLLDGTVWVPQPMPLPLYRTFDARAVALALVVEAGGHLLIEHDGAHASRCPCDACRASPQGP